MTPIGRYLEIRRADPKYKPQLEFACVLLYREREYRSFYSSGWRPARLPASRDDGPFQPFDLTDPAAATLAGAIRATWGLEPVAVGAPEDLFGLKPEAIDGLGSVLRPGKALTFGHLVYSRLLCDVARFDDAMAASVAALDQGADEEMAFALSYQAAVLRGGSAETAEQVDREARTRLQHLGKKSVRWYARGIERFEEKVRREALRIRGAEEGESFTRFLATEAEFCERERRAALETFDATKVPPDFVELIDVARRFGVGDDVCRGLFVRKTSAAEKRTVVAAVQPHASRIQAWLDSLGGPPFGCEASAFFWLLEAVEEMTLATPGKRR